MNVWRSLVGTALLMTVSSAAAIDISRQSRPGPDLVTADMVIQADLREVRAALETPCAVRLWLPRTRDIRILDRDGDGLTRIRVVTDFPWPWNDRVAILDFRHHRPGPDHLQIQMQAVDTGDTPDDLVAVTESSAHWDIRAITDGVRIHYRQTFNPAGTVPQWLADRVAGTQVRHALENLRKLLEQDGGRDRNCHWLPDADTDGTPRGGGAAQSPGLP